MKYISLLFFIVLGLAAGKEVISMVSKPIKTLQSSAVPVDINLSPTPTQEAVARPTALAIPKLKVSTKIEEVGLDNKGAMDTPQDPKDVAWFELGPVPGQMGSAVIAGHLDWYTGPSVFWDLNKLQNNDLIQVTDEKGITRNFRVIDKQSYDDSSFPMNEVFGQNDNKRLNLITCAGIYDRASQNYQKRLVVYTVLDSVKEAAR